MSENTRSTFQSIYRIKECSISLCLNSFRGNWIWPTAWGGKWPKLRIGELATRFFRGLENGRHISGGLFDNKGYFLKPMGWKVTDLYETSNIMSATFLSADFREKFVSPVSLMKKLCRPFSNPQKKNVGIFQSPKLSEYFHLQMSANLKLPLISLSINYDWDAWT